MRRLLVPFLVAAFAVVASPSVAETDHGDACAPPAPLAFESHYIDTGRAGGEPIVATHPTGRLLWGSHAGTTHFYSPAAPDEDTAAFVENYQGQTYQYLSDDGGETWEFVERLPISEAVGTIGGLPNSGFSDPEFAIDTAGNVFISEINLANIAISKSSNAGASYELMNVAAVTMSDRQWMEADEEDVLWFVANTFGGGSPMAGEPLTGSLDHRIYKSTDGGATLSEGQSLGRQQSSDIKIDRTDGRLYELHTQGSTLRMWIAPDARNQTPPDLEFLLRDGTTTSDTSRGNLDAPIIADRYDRKTSIGPTFETGPDGNLHVVWDDHGGQGRAPGIYYTYSTDRGLTWAHAMRLDDGTGTAFWPWIAAGSEGVVAVWLQNEQNIPGHDPEAATAGWHVMAAQSLTPTGCDADGDGQVDTPPVFTVTQASDEPVHEGTVCTGGTFCQAEVVDRRLGDYFANAIDRDGNVYISVSDTRSGGAVALPLVIRQTGGPTVGDLYEGATWLDAETADAPAVARSFAAADGWMTAVVGRAR